MTPRSSRFPLPDPDGPTKLGLSMGSSAIHVRDGDIVVWHDRHGNVRGVVKVNSGGAVEFVPSE